MARLEPRGMQRTYATRTTGVTDVTLDAGGITLPRLRIEPPGPSPRASVVAAHGGGMTAGGFDRQAHPSGSLLGLGARLGLAVLSLDRPGYGRSAREFPHGQSLTERSATLHAALDDHARRLPKAAGFSLGWAARSYHLRVLAFLEELLAPRGQVGA
ncbi:hypothetical protein [Streptomyces sp. NPDC060027]|uniref:hypothetical protein n=1 Tax=Streptomyces sp. NPDC060027 TaxID=3347040 RepID=UPI0036B39FB8